MIRRIISNLIAISYIVCFAVAKLIPTFPLRMGYFLISYFRCQFKLSTYAKFLPQLSIFYGLANLQHVSS